MLNGMTLKDQQTTPAVFSGTSYVFASDGAQIVGGMHLVDTTASDYLTRCQMTVKNRPTTLNARSGLLSKEKRSVSISKPFTPANNTTPGGVVFTTVRIEVENHPEATADATKIIGILRNFIDSSAAQDFLNRGTLA